MYKLKVFRDKAAGTPDLLNWAALVDPGVVQGKDGALMAGWAFRGPDIESQTATQRNYTSMRVNEVLSRLDSGWVSWTDAVRMRSTDYPARDRSFFPDPVTRAIDEERRRMFEAEGAHYETEYVLIVQYMPPKAIENRFVELFYNDDGRTGRGDLGTRVLERFNRALTEIEDGLQQVLKLRRLTGCQYEGDGGITYYQDDLLAYLQGLMMGEPSPITVPPCAMYLDAILGGQELWTGDTPKLGENYIACVGVEGYPEGLFPNILSLLCEMPMRFRWSTRMIYLDEHEAEGEINSFRRKWAQRQRSLIQQTFNPGGGGRVNQDAVDMVEEADSALSQAKSGIVRYGYKTTIIVLMEPDRRILEENAREVRKLFGSLGFPARIETLNTLEAWLGSLPGHARPNIRRPMAHTLNLADMLPLSSVWAGRDECPCPPPRYPAHSPPLFFGHTVGTTPFRGNLHFGDIAHTLIFGPTGAGKSTLLGIIAAQFRRYPDSFIAAFDKGNSLFPLARAVGGAHYTLGVEEGSPGFAPLAILDTAADLMWAEDWIETCYVLSCDTPMTPTQKSMVHKAMLLLQAGDPTRRGITEFCSNVQDSSIRDALKFYTVDGNVGALLDRHQDELQDNNFVVFEMDALLEMKQKVVGPVLLYLFRRLQKRLRGQPSLFILDEAWTFLSHPMFAAKIKEWLKTLRKLNCGVILATQSLNDAISSGLFDVLLESCPTRIFLPNMDANKRGAGQVVGPRDMYTMFGLNDTQIDILESAVYKKQYYFASPEGQRLFELGAGPLALSFVGASSPQEIARVRELETRFGPEWPTQWLMERGVDHALLAA